MLPSQGSKTRIIQAALRLFAAQGYHNTGIADIIRESGVLRGTLYYYFPCKEELAYAALDEAIRALYEEGAAAYLQTGEHPIDRLLSALDALPNITKMGTVGSSATDVALRMAAVHDGFRRRLTGKLVPALEQVEEIVGRGVADGQIADSVDPRQLAHLFVTIGAGIQLVTLLWDREDIWEDARDWLKEYLNSLRR